MTNRFKKYIGLNVPIWMQSRKSLFIFLCVDFLVFIGIKTGGLRINVSPHYISYIIFLSIAWCLISYVMGRYSYFIDINYLNKKIYKLFTNTIITLTIIYILEKLLIILVSEIIPFGRLNIILLGIFSFIIQSLKFFLNIRGNFKSKLFLLGSEEEIHEFRNFIELFLKDNKIQLINYSKNKTNLIKNESILIFKKAISSAEYNYIYNNYIKLNLKIFSPCEWCEIHLQQIPIKFFSNKEYQTNDWRIKTDIFQWRLKRFGDISVSLILIILSIPILVFFALLIWFEDNGPIFYYQIRTGLGGKEFKIAKLRTMNFLSEKNGAIWASKNDPRITKIGKVLRKTRIDELPQLISVILGDMSLIGPRPERPEIEILLKKNIPYYELRNTIKPGLSGWAQVNYPYGASVNDSKNKLSYDLFYIKNYSFWLDFLIFIKTIKLVLNMKGSNPAK